MDKELLNSYGGVSLHSRSHGESFLALVQNRFGGEGLYIFDEPEAGIDLWSFARLTETFRELHEKGGRTILIISHQERIIRLADEIILIANGEIAGRGTADELYPKLLSQTVAGCNLLEVNGIC